MDQNEFTNLAISLFKAFKITALSKIHESDELIYTVTEVEDLIDSRFEFLKSSACEFIKDQQNGNEIH